MSNAIINLRFGTLRVQVLRDRPYLRMVLMPKRPEGWPWFEAY